MAYFDIGFSNVLFFVRRQFHPNATSTAVLPELTCLRCGHNQLHVHSLDIPCYGLLNVEIVQGTVHAYAGFSMFDKVAFNYLSHPFVDF